ncbi:hypothetical protein ID866_6236 [Astraeus odoratus]|nr:hypothetical protein ID866_6236 [Astraeus odoratus]
MNPAQVAHGPFLIGVAINIMLYGIMITQTYLYFAAYKSDRLWMKMFVAFLLLTDTVNTLFDFIYAYQSLVNHFGDASWLTEANWVFATGEVESSYNDKLRSHRLTIPDVATRRSYHDWHYWRIGSTILFLACAGIFGSLGTTIAVGIVPAFVEFQKFEVIVIIWLAGAALADTIIATSLVLHLRSKKNEFPATSDAIDRVIRCELSFLVLEHKLRESGMEVTVQTGLITTLCAIVDLATYLAIVSITAFQLIDPITY